MPTYITQRMRGRGKYRARAVIEGWPQIFVSDRSLVRTLPDGREQIVGLDLTSLRFAARADLPRAELRAQEMTLSIVDTAPDHLVTRSLHRTTGRKTWLTADVSATATTIPVADTSAFPTQGVIHIGTEAIRYNGKSAGTFANCTRGYWGTTAQAHTIGEGDDTWYPPVTDLPRELTGRRVRIDLYGTGDSASGNGTPRWRGICRGGVDYAEGVYSIAVDPVTYVLEQQLGADLGDEVPLRGIYLPSEAAFTATVQRHTGPSSSSSIATFFKIRISGFFPTQAEFLAEVNAQIAANMPTFGLDPDASLRAIETEEGYRFAYLTGSTTAHYVSIIGGKIEPMVAPRVLTTFAYGLSPVDFFDRHTEGTAVWLNDGDPFTTLALGREYETHVRASVPRTYVCRVKNTRQLFRDITDLSHPIGRLYLGGGLTPTAGAEVAITVDSDLDPMPPMGTVGASSAERYVDLESFAVPMEHPLGPATRVKLYRVLATGHVGDLISALIVDSPALVNSGAMPLLTADDFVADFAELEAAISGVALGARRTFVVSEGVSLGELLAEELKLVGCYLALDDQGRMRIRRLRLATLTDESVVDLDSRKIKGAFPQFSASAEGILGTVLIKQGYDPVEGEHTGITYPVRNTTSPTHLAGTLTIAPLSRRADIPPENVEVQPEDAFALASAVLGLFGETYEIVSLEVGSESEGIGHGDTVTLTTPHLPGADGTMGLVEKPAQALGYDWSPAEGRGTLDLLIHHRRIAGYAPGFPIASQSGSGATWTLTVTTAGYAPSGTDATTWFGPGDKIRVTRRNTSTPQRLAGTVTAVTATTISVQLDAPWTPTGEWRIAYQAAPGVNEAPAAGRRWAQSDFGFIADAFRRISFASGDVDAQEFAP